MAEQTSRLDRYLENARARSGQYAFAAVSAARAGLGVRVAVVGKGGVGKTVIAGTLARLLARQGRQVLAADLDHVPGLASSIGLGAIEGLPSTSILELGENTPQGWQFEAGTSQTEVIERCAVRGPDGVRLLSAGKVAHADATATRSSITALTQGLLLGLTEPDWNVVGDMEAGATQSFQGHHSFCDDVILVVGPTWRSALTARRLLPMFGDRRVVVVGNRYRDSADHPGLEADVRVPEDPEVAEAERCGLSPVDACPEAPAIRAIAELAGGLVSGWQASFSVGHTTAGLRRRAAQL